MSPTLQEMNAFTTVQHFWLWLHLLNTLNVEYKRYRYTLCVIASRTTSVVTPSSVKEKDSNESACSHQSTFAASTKPQLTPSLSFNSWNKICLEPSVSKWCLDVDWSTRTNPHDSAASGSGILTVGELSGIRSSLGIKAFSFIESGMSLINRASPAQRHISTQVIAKQIARIMAK